MSSPAFFTSLLSRQDHIGEKMLSAARFGFGGQVQGQEPIDPEPKPWPNIFEISGLALAEQMRRVAKDG